MKITTSFIISFGNFGGFSIDNFPDAITHICLGWVSIGVYPNDINKLIAKALHLIVHEFNARGVTESVTAPTENTRETELMHRFIVGKIHSRLHRLPEAQGKALLLRLYTELSSIQTTVDEALTVFEKDHPQEAQAERKKREVATMVRLNKFIEFLEGTGGTS